MNSITKLIGKISYSFLIVFILTLLSSCEDDYYGRDGRPGRAYLSLSWSNEIPEYIDASTSDIPPTFKWGDNYRTSPGNYVLYYEGSVWNGFGFTSYAYDVEYEIIENPGKEGQPYNIDGRDGKNTYLTIECSPYGPYLFSNKRGTVSKNYEIINNNDDSTEVVQKGENFSIKIIYRKANPRKEK